MDTVVKRRAALGISTIMLPMPDSAIDDTDRAVMLKCYPLSLLTSAVQSMLGILGNGFLTMFG